jgi:serine/threonine-protein kinase
VSAAATPPALSIARRARAAALAACVVLTGATVASAEAMTPAQQKAMTAIFGDGARGGQLFRAGRTAEAEEVFRSVLRRVEKDFPREPLMRAASLHNLAGAIAERGGLVEAERTAREALALREGRGVAPAIASTRLLLGGILVELGRAEEALPLLRAAVATLLKDPAADRADGLRAAALLATVEAEVGDADAAATLARDLAALAGDLDRRPDLAEPLFAAIGRVHAVAGSASEAEVWYRRAAAAVDRTRADADRRRAVLVANVASTLLDQGRAAEALPLAERAVAAQPAGSASPVARAAALVTLGEARRVGGDTAGAFAARREALDLRLATLPGEHPVVAQSLSVLGLDLLSDGRIEPARRSLAAALERRRRIGDRIGALRSTLSLAVAEAASSHPAEAERLSAEGLADAAAMLPLGHPLRVAAAVNRGWLLLGAGRPEEALAVARRAATDLKARFAASATRAERLELPARERRGIVVLVAAAWDVAAGRRGAPSAAEPRRP